MRKVLYKYNTKASANLKDILDRFNFFGGYSDTIEELGLAFYQDELISRDTEEARDIWGIASVVDEKKYMIARIKYGI